MKQDEIDELSQRKSLQPKIIFSQNINSANNLEPRADNVHIEKIIFPRLKSVKESGGKTIFQINI